MYVKDPWLAIFVIAKWPVNPADRVRDSDGLLCLFVFSFPVFFDPFQFSSHIYPHLLASPRLLVLHSQFLFHSVSCQVVELKSQLKLRSLPVSGTKNDLIERLRTYQELNGGSDTPSSPTAGGATGSGAEGAGRSSKTAVSTTSNSTSQQQQQFQFQCQQASSLTGQSADCCRFPLRLTQKQHIHISFVISFISVNYW